MQLIQQGFFVVAWSKLLFFSQFYSIDPSRFFVVAWSKMLFFSKIFAIDPATFLLLRDLNCCFFHIFLQLNLIGGSLLSKVIRKCSRYLLGSFQVLPPPLYVMHPQLLSTCHYIVNFYIKIWHVSLGYANNFHPLNGGGGRHKRKRSIWLYSFFLLYNFFIWSYAFCSRSKVLSIS